MKSNENKNKKPKKNDKRNNASDRANAEYAAGESDYERWKFNLQMFDESLAAAEELAWNLRYGGW